MKKIKRSWILFLWVFVFAGLFHFNGLSSFAASGLSTLSNPDVGDYEDYGCTGSIQPFTAPVDGVYKLEVWGGQGGYRSVTSNNKGGYSCGYKYLDKGQTIYVCVGGAGTVSSSYGAFSGGYNGGGAAWNREAYAYGSSMGGSGGGATHISSTNRGVLSNYNSYRSEVLIVAGGGGGNGIVVGRSETSGGSGGGTSGGNGVGYNTTTGVGTGGTQTAAGKSGWETWGSFGAGAKYCTWGPEGSPGGGGGWYGGGSSLNDHGDGNVRAVSAAGGSGYIGGVPSITFYGILYKPSTANNVKSGNGGAKITLEVKALSVELPEYSSYTEQDHYSISASVSGVVSYKWQIRDSSGNWAELYNSESGVLAGNVPEGFDDVRFTDSISNRNGTLTVSGTVTGSFDGKRIRIIVTGEDGDTCLSESILQVTSVEPSVRSVVGQIGEATDFYFTVHGAKSASLQVRAYNTDTWETYSPAAGVVNNPITSKARDGEVTFHFDSLTENDLKKYYRIVLTNDGSGLISDEIFLTSCIYNMNYDADTVDTLMYDEEAVNAVYFNTGTDWVLVYGFE